MGFQIFPTSSPLTLDDFKKFSEEKTIGESTIVAKNFFGSSPSPTYTRNIEPVFGDTSEIVETFKQTLLEKYGEEITSLSFSHENQQTALQQGLDKAIIAHVLKTAKAIDASDFLQYKSAMLVKKDAAEKHLPNPKITDVSGGNSFKKECDQIEQHYNNSINTFSDWLSGGSKEAPEKLKEKFQANLTEIDKLSRQIIDAAPQKKTDPSSTKISQKPATILQEKLNITEKQAEEKIAMLRERMGAPLADILLKNLLEHTEFTGVLQEMVNAIEKEASTHSPNPARSSEESESNPMFDIFDPTITEKAPQSKLLTKHPRLKNVLDLLTIAPGVIEGKIEVLSPGFELFTDRIRLKDAKPDSYFYVDQDNTLSLYTPETEQSSPPSKEQQEIASQRFFSKLGFIFGTNFIDLICSREQQQQPLTIEKKDKIFKEIRETFQNLDDFLEKNPAIITPELIIKFADNVDEATAALISYENLEKSSLFLLGVLQETGFSAAIIGSTKATLYFSDLATTGGLGCMTILLVTAVVEGYLAGFLIAGQSGLSGDKQNEAAAIEASAMAASVAGDILKNMFQSSINAYVPPIISSTIATYGSNVIALLLRKITLNALKTGEEQSKNGKEANSSMAPKDSLSPEERLFHFLNVNSQIEEAGKKINRLIIPTFET